MLKSRITLPTLLTLSAVFFSAAEARAQDGAAEDAAAKWAVFESEPLDIYYPVSRRQYLEGIGLVRQVKEAFEELHTKHAAFGEKVLVIVYDRDTLNSDPKDDLIPGYTGVIEPKDPALPEKIIRVVLTVWGVNEEVIRHELFHAMLLSNGIEPQRWLNEGLAYHHQHEDGFLPRWYELLEKKDALPLAELPDSTAVADSTELEHQRQATGWAMVYYLKEIEGKSTLEVLRLAQKKKLPDPQAAFESVKRYRKLVEEEQRHMEERLKKKATELRIPRRPSE